MKKVLFIDRDGTILVEPEDEQVDSFEKFSFLPGAISSLSKIADELDFELVMITNQDGLGTDSYPEEKFWPIQNKMLEILKGEGIHFSQIFIDRSLPEEKAPTRKPGTAMLTKYLASGIDLENSYVLGDRETDIELAANIGCNVIFIGKKRSGSATFSTDKWGEIYTFLKNKPRKSSVIRKTSETSVLVEVNLDGTGRSNISTGLGFFDHLLDQIPNHGKFDLAIKVKGDLQVDEHHTIEDVALALGDAFSKALGKKKGIGRYGFTIPMDDSLASVAIDFSGRPWLEWNAVFEREKIGDVPTEMFIHFFKSFTDSAKCTLNIKVDGSNEHHKIESVFKAFARCAAMASARTGNSSIPSSKGSI